MEESKCGPLEQRPGEALALLKELGAIPAPSHKEDLRAEFCRRWLTEQGADPVFIDEAKNVIYPYRCEEKEEIVVFMAHTDVVFPDTEPFTVRQEGNRLYAPGIGDDTANLVNLLLAARYMAENRPETSAGILFAADSCEEGLGNLKGCRKLMETYGSRIKEVVSFDCGIPALVNAAVGSQRYKVTVRTEGGHSFGDFGRRNAIHCLCCIVRDLYETEVPTEAKTTYNVGCIEGGTTVNSIAQEAHMLYEFRSVDHGCLKRMEQNFEKLITAYRNRGLDIEVETVGIRPCGRVADDGRMDDIVKRYGKIIRSCTGEEPDLAAASTDANIPLSMGIPAVTLGTVRGKGAHTREEWIDIGSMETGMRIAFACMESLIL